MDGGGADGAGGGAPPAEPPFTFLDMPCDLVSCLGPVASTPGYAEEIDGTQRLCRAARDDTMLSAATADLRYKRRRRGDRSRLQYVCRVNDEARVTWLVECGARDVLAATEDGYAGGAALVRRLAPHPLVDATEALVAAAAVGAVDQIAPLLGRGAQINRAVPDTRFFNTVLTLTALQAASRRGQLEAVRALLVAGAAVDAVSKEGGTALSFAADGAQLEAAQALVAAGADVNRRDAEDFCPAAWAWTEESKAVAAYLCHLPQAEPSAHIAAAAWVGDAELVRAFLARGADVEEPAKSGGNCLSTAANEGHVEVVRALLAAGADVAVELGDGGRAILSCGVEHPAVLALLLEHFEVGGDAERQAQLNHALFMAVGGDTPEALESARLLLAAGADVDGRVSEEDEEAHMVIMTSGHISMLRAAAEASSVAAFRLLLDAGADLAGLDRKATPAEEIRRCSWRPEAVPALLEALVDAATAGGGGGAAPGGGVAAAGAGEPAS
jgi:ankyrin repeat protein